MANLVVSLISTINNSLLGGCTSAIQLKEDFGLSTSSTYSFKLRVKVVSLEKDVSGRSVITG